MSLIGEQYMRTPFYGSRRMTAWLQRQGYEMNRRRVGRLIRMMRTEAIYPKLRLGQGGAEPRIYPYLLRGLVVD